MKIGNGSSHHRNSPRRRRRCYNGIARLPLVMLFGIRKLVICLGWLVWALGSQKSNKLTRAKERVMLKCHKMTAINWMSKHACETSLHFCDTVERRIKRFPARGASPKTSRLLLLMNRRQKQTKGAGRKEPSSSISTDGEFRTDAIGRFHSAHQQPRARATARKNNNNIFRVRKKPSSKEEEKKRTQEF